MPVDASGCVELRFDGWFDASRLADAKFFVSGPDSADKLRDRVEREVLRLAADLDGNPELAGFETLGVRFEHDGTPVRVCVHRPTTLVDRYRKFVHDLVRMTEGGPPAHLLADAIESDKVNLKSVSYMLAGIRFESYTEPPSRKMA